MVNLYKSVNVLLLEARLQKNSALRALEARLLMGPQLKKVIRINIPQVKTESEEDPRITKLAG